MPAFSLKLLAPCYAAFLLFAATAHASAATEYDDKAAVIFAYFAVGRDDAPAVSVTQEQFSQQVEEIATGGYVVLPLPEIVASLASEKTLPPRAVAITFDGADKSVIDIAAPLLLEKEIPFTVFIPSRRVAEAKPPFLSWDDLRRLKKTGLVSFGLHPASYSRLANRKDEDIKREINRSLADIREELDITPSLFAYPFGEYDPQYQKIVRDMGFKAAFAQQSGVAHAGDDRFAFPRFTLTESYGDMERFIMTANALPLPVMEVAPANPSLATLEPAIGFTLPDSLAAAAKSVSCFSSGHEKPQLTILGDRVEIRVGQIRESRLRINCTMPVAAGPGDDPRWRWLGMMYIVPAGLMQQTHITSPQEHAGAFDDTISVE